MTEKKNYCVDGKCTNHALNMNDCTHSNCFPLDCAFLEIESECSSKEANAEYQESQK